MIYSTQRNVGKSLTLSTLAKSRVLDAMNILCFVPVVIKQSVACCWKLYDT